MSEGKRRRRRRLTPFMKQCFVTAGVSVNMASAGLVMGFTAGLLDQLKTADSTIPVDDSSGSWIAALPGFSLVVGNFIVPVLMSRYGRKSANLVSIAPLLLGWVCIVFATNVPALLVARFLQGLCMGMCTSLGSLLIGEYTSPKNRGAFLMTISVSIAIAVLVVHVMGSYMSWQKAATVCAGVALVDLVIVISSPESPSWLAERGRYEDSRKVFRWLRGDGEEVELKNMIEANSGTERVEVQTPVGESLAERSLRNINYFRTTVAKKEFYKPIIIMMHVYTIAQWSGINILVPYATDLLQRLVGSDVDAPLQTITLDIHRIIANILAIYIIKKIKRRKMLFTTVGINIFALSATAVYSYAKEKGSLPVDHPLIGIALTHVLMFAVATGSLSLCFIIAGEVFPLQYKNLAAGISVLFYSGNLFVTVKTVPYLFHSLGVHGTYCVYAVILSYCLLVTWKYLPETKDRTLQDIEDEFKYPHNLGVTARPLTSRNLYDHDRRCSTPTLV